MRAQLLHLCPTLCDPMYCSLPGSSVHGFLQARILECVAIVSSAGGLRDQTCISCFAGGFFTVCVTGEAGDFLMFAFNSLFTFSFLAFMFLVCRS